MWQLFTPQREHLCSPFQRNGALHFHRIRGTAISHTYKTLRRNAFSCNSLLCLYSYVASALCQVAGNVPSVCVFFNALEGSSFHSQGSGSLFTTLLKTINFLSPFTARYVSTESIFQIKSHIEKISHWLLESKHNINVHPEKDSRGVSAH